MVTPDNLYIVGNGFDLYHRLATRYVDFAFFLRDNEPEIYELYTHYFALPDVDLDDPKNSKLRMWNEFEARLSSFDADNMIEDNWDLADGPKAPDYKQFDTLVFSIEMQAKVDKLTKEMPEAFREFILSRERQALSESRQLNLLPNSVYLNFNYTDTLEYYYHLNHRRILYIHGQAARPDSRIILGHGVVPETLYQQPPEKPEEPPKGLTDDQLEAWHDIQSNKYDPSTEYAIQSLQTYYYESHKPTEAIVKENKAFFRQLHSIHAVYILGHSIAAVDQQYFRTVVDSVKPNDTDWFVSYYMEPEKKRHTDTLKKFGIPAAKIHMFQLPEMVRKVPELFDVK